MKLPEYPVIQISKVRDRDFVLRTWLPHALSLIDRFGQEHQVYGGSVVKLEGNVTLCLSRMSHTVWALSVYSFVHGNEKKVFSAHIIGSGESAERSVPLDVGSSINLLSWRRGLWEDVVLAQGQASDADSDLKILSGGSQTLH